MTQFAGPASPNARAPAAPTPARRSEPAPEQPRQQVENRSARDRFAARLERENGSGSSRDAGEAKVQNGDRSVRRARPEEDRSGAEDQRRDGGQHQAHGFAAHLASASGIAAPGPVAPGAAAAAVPIDTALLERMAAQIAEGWPAGGSEAATIAFPGGAIASGAQVVRAGDGSLGVTILGLDPRISASHSARLQIELANALARRRLRVRSVRFEGAAASQRGRGSEPAGSLPGAAAAIPRVV